MKFQDSSFNGLKVTVGTKKCDPPTHARSKSNMPHQLFQSWGHKNLPLKPSYRYVVPLSYLHFHFIPLLKLDRSHTWDVEPTTQGPRGQQAKIQQHLQNTIDMAWLKYSKYKNDSFRTDKSWQTVQTSCRSWHC